MVGENVDLPSNFPKDVPIYEGATVVRSSTQKRFEADVTNVSLQTEDDFQKVAHFYEQRLAQSGHEEGGSSDIEAPGPSMWS